jgi:ribonuclease HI
MPENSGSKKVTIHTDGACDGNPGPGGWSAVLRSGNDATGVIPLPEEKER